MKRSFVLLVMLVLIGAAANLPFALRFLHSRTSPRAPMISNEMGATAAALPWPARTPHDRAWPAPTQYQVEGSFAYRNINVYGADPDGDANSRFQMQVERIGWPLPVLERVQMWWPWNDAGWASSAAPDPAMRVAWTGAVLNPLIFGVTAWMVLVAPVTVFAIARRRLRHAHNCCTRCGYPLGGAARCAECGLEAASRRDPALPHARR